MNTLHFILTIDTHQLITFITVYNSVYYIIVINITHSYTLYVYIYYCIQYIEDINLMWTL